MINVILSCGKTVLLSQSVADLLPSIDKLGYATVMLNEEQKDITFNSAGQLVEPVTGLISAIQEQPEKITNIDDVIWTPRFNYSHYELRVTHSASFNNGKFQLGMTEAGHYSLFHDVVGQLNDSIKLESVSLKDAIKEASSIALSKTI